jgi:hypothetical protein
VFLSSGIAHAQRAETILQLRHHALGDRLVHEQSRSSAADLALVEEDAVDDALDRLVERSVVEHDVGRLAAELHRHASCRCRRPNA